MVNFNLATYLAQNAAGVGVLGAIVGVSAQAAKSFSDHKKGLVDRKQAVQDTGKEAAGAGVATAISAMAAAAVGGGLLLSLGPPFWQRRPRNTRGTAASTESAR